tara:strand:- start:1574 stop:2167 length:594 start_codon:yes stop_codon:yes gene_type:complete
MESDETIFVNQIPTIVKQAEDRILNSVQLAVFRKSAAGVTSASVPTVALPSDFLTPYSISIETASNYEFLLLKDVSFLREAYPALATTGAPRYYAVLSDTEAQLAPVPDAIYVVDFQYFYRPASIVDSGTSWLGTNAESCLLHACLVEAHVFQKSEEVELQKASVLLDTALVELKDLGEGYGQTDNYRAGAKRERRA